MSGSISVFDRIQQLHEQISRVENQIKEYMSKSNDADSNTEFLNYLNQQLTQLNKEFDSIKKVSHIDTK